MKHTEFGDRMKMYEKLETSRKFMPLVPIIARMDGKNFHRFAKKMDRPFDEGFRDVMATVTKRLVEETGALVGYTQSDEITLLFFSNTIKSQIFLNHKIHKMISILAAMTTMYFNEQNYLPSSVFDARVFQVPTKEEAVNQFLFREYDAITNSISAVAQACFSDAELFKKNTSMMQDMLMLKEGINWNDFDSRYKRGTYFRKIHTKRKFTSEEMDKLPLKHQARKNPDLQVVRGSVERLIMPPLQKVVNRIDVFFNEVDPKIVSEDYTIKDERGSLKVIICSK